MLYLHHHISFQAEIREKNKRPKMKKSLPGECFFKKVSPSVLISLNTVGSLRQKGGWKWDYFSFLVSIEREAILMVLGK